MGLNMKPVQTQGRRLIAMLKRASMTYIEMNLTGISVSPHKRVLESLREDERLVKLKDSRGRLRWRVVAATKWTR
jgi:hypothetical protein